MKGLKYVLSIVLIMFFALPSQAQMMGNQDSTYDRTNRSRYGNTMHHNMMGNNQNYGMRRGHMMGHNNQNGWMMNQNSPIKKYIIMINRLPNMKSPLNLTEEQSMQLKNLQTDFTKKRIDIQANISKQKLDLENLLSSGASSSELRSEMQKIADMKINMNIAAYEIAQEMKALLNEDQKQNLDNMFMDQGYMGNGIMQNNMMYRDDDDYDDNN